MVAGRAGFLFSRRDVRDQTGWGATQIRVHLDRLHEMEYLIVHHGGRGQSYVYELDLAAPGATWRAQNGPQTAGWRGIAGLDETRITIAPNGVLIDNREKRTSAGMRANGQP